MCVDIFHTCKYCGRTYKCGLPNDICPTINFDKDKQLCDHCRSEFEVAVRSKIIPEKFKELM